MRTLRFALAGVLAVGAAGCKDVLNVENENAADRTRALARPTDVEALIGASYRQIHLATLNSSGDMIQTQSQVMALENYSNLANFGFNLRSGLPRTPIDNARNNPANTGNYRDFQILHRAARQAAVGLSAVNQPSFTFFPPSTPQVARAKALAHFVIGAALGDVALIYDQGSAISPNDNGNDPTPLPLVAYDSLMRYALAELDSAIAIATPATGCSGLPCWITLTAGSNWFGSPSVAMTQAQFIGLARGYKARLRAGVARTPADRAAVDWTKVIADALAAAAAWPTNVVLTMTPSAGWDILWYSSQSQASNANQWQEQWMFIMGMADTTTSDAVAFPGCATQPYVCWLNTPYTSKAAFLVRTADKRFPAGATRALQQAVGQGNPCTSPMPAGVYFRNRSAPDWSADPVASSWYDQERWSSVFCAASRIGPFAIMTTAELNMLAAEGYIRQGNFAGATTLINLTRTTNGLPAIAGITAATDVIGPDAIHCVPHVPVLAASRSAGTVTCATIMEAMKWEKRLETSWTGPYMWFTDGRGWGDLPAGTALMWPLPYQEIDSRQTFPNPPSYATPVYGGPGGPPNSAPVGTYGLQ